MDRKQREERRRQEDIALNRALLWVVAAIVLEALLLLADRYYINYMLQQFAIAEAIGNVLKVLRFVAPVAAVAGIVLGLVRMKKTGHIGALAVVITGLGASLWVCAQILYRFRGNGLRMLLLLVPAWAGLALVYYLYQRELFFSAAATGLGVMGLWFVRYGTMTYVVLSIAAIVVLAAAVLVLRAGDGAVRLLGMELRVFPKEAGYLPVLLTCVVNVAVILAALAAGSTVAYYLVYAMLAWLFALLVYYTVKLM